MALGFDGTLITLVDEDGVEKEFEHIYTIENGGETYIGLIPVAESAEELLDSDGELVILKVMVDEKGEPFTAHTTNLVPFYIVGASVKLRDGRLADIAPTMLDLMGLEKPAEMDGKTLIVP